MIPQFALRLIFGLAVMWCLSPRREITSGFFRIQMLIALGLSVLLAVTGSQLQEAHARIPNGMILAQFAIALLLGGVSFLGSIFWTLERRAAGATAAWTVLLLSNLGVIFQSVLSIYGTARHPGLPIVEALSSAHLIGAVTATMLLGHWYLTATGMKLTPLIEYNRLFLGAVVLRMVVAGIDLSQHWTQAADNWTLSTLRWGGLVGPLVMGLLVQQILKYRNTQSATGVLYAATTLVFMGEMAAALIGRP